MHRGMPYPIARAATNVALRDLSTALVIEEMYRGTPVIYVDYTDYDEIAHHSGPERGETLDALDEGTKLLGGEAGLGHAGHPITVDDTRPVAGARHLRGPGGRCNANNGC